MSGKYSLNEDSKVGDLKRIYWVLKPVLLTAFISSVLLITQNSISADLVGKIGSNVTYRSIAVACASGDLDSDGIQNLNDNCIEIPNASQLDVNSDGYGNACDADLNDDLVVNFLDVGIFRDNFFDVGESISDFDGDGFVNFLDLAILESFLFQQPGLSHIDCPVASWRFDEENGPNVLDDLSLLTGTLVPSGTEGPQRVINGRCVSQNCLLFDGVNDVVDFGPGMALSLDGDLTLSMWLSSDGRNTLETVFTNGATKVYKLEDNRVHFQQSASQELAHENLVANGDFELVSEADPTLPLGWVRGWNTPDENAVVSRESHSNKNSLLLTTDVTRGWQNFETPVVSLLDTQTYRPGEAYELSFWAKYDNPYTRGNIRIFYVDDNVETIIGIIGLPNRVNEHWQFFSLNFNMPSQSDLGLTLRIGHTNWDQPGRLWIDQVRVTQGADSNRPGEVGIADAEHFPVGAWQHLVVVKKNSDLELWLNGVKTREATLFQNYGLETGDIDQLLLGGGEFHFRGLMDEVQVFDRALSSSEICQLCEVSGSTECCEPTCAQDYLACSNLACSDGIDNDRDGLIDNTDPGCQSDENSEMLAADYQGLELNELEQMFDTKFASQWGSGDNAIVTIFPYAMMPYISGLVNMYQATQDQTYIETALLSVEAAFDEMTDVNGDGHLEWTSGPSLYTPFPAPFENIQRTTCLYTERGAKEFARLARIIKKDEALNLEFGARADEVISNIETSVVNDPFCGDRFYPLRTDVHHIVGHSTSILLELLLIHEDPNYVYRDGQSWKLLSTLETRGNALRNTIFEQPEDPEAMAWGSTRCMDLNYSYPECYNTNPCPDSTGRTWCAVADTSHAVDAVMSMIQLYRADIVFTLDDMRSLVHTYLNRVWNKRFLDPRFSDYIDGNNAQPGGTYEEWVQGSSLAPGWSSLASFSPELRLVLEAALTSEHTNKAWRNDIALIADIARAINLRECQFDNYAKELNDGLDNDCDGHVDEGF